VQGVGEQGDAADCEHEWVYRPPPRFHVATLEPGRAHACGASCVATAGVALVRKQRSRLGTRLIR
jgi:hypothetical protein